MAKVVVSLFLDQKEYLPGTRVTGRLEVQTSRLPLEIKSLYIHSNGICKVHWNVTTEDKDGESHTTLYKAEEEYFSYKFTLLNQGEILEPKCVFPFNFLLPEDLPPSFVGDHGFIKYSVTSVLDSVDPDLHRSEEKEFSIFLPVNFDDEQHALKPICIEADKTFCCLWCKSGPLLITVTAPQTGYHCGDVIPVTIEVENGSKVQLKSIICCIIERVRFVTSSPSQDVKVSRECLWSWVGPAIQPHTTETLSCQLSIPNLKRVCLLPSNIISLSYLLKVAAESPGIHDDIILETPIKLATKQELTDATAPSASVAFNEAFDQVDPAPNQPQPSVNPPPFNADMSPQSLGQLKFNPAMPSQNVGQLTFNPAMPSQNIGQLAVNPAMPSKKVGQLTVNPALPSQYVGQMTVNPAMPSQNVGQMTVNPAMPSQKVERMAVNSAMPSQKVGQMTVNPAIPSQYVGQMTVNPTMPSQNVGQLTFNPALPSHNVGHMTFNPAMPPHNVGHMTFNPAFPSHNGGQMAFNPVMPSQSVGQIFKPAMPSQSVEQITVNSVMPSQKAEQLAVNPAMPSQKAGQLAVNPAMPSQKAGQITFDPSSLSLKVGEMSFNPVMLLQKVGQLTSNSPMTSKSEGQLTFNSAMTSKSERKITVNSNSTMTSSESVRQMSFNSAMPSLNVGQFSFNRPMSSRRLFEK